MKKLLLFIFLFIEFTTNSLICSNNKTWKDVPSKVRVLAPFKFSGLFISAPQEKYDWLQKYLKRDYQFPRRFSMSNELTSLAPYQIFDCYHAYLKMKSEKDDAAMHKHVSTFAYQLKNYLQCPYIAQYSKEDQKNIKIIGTKINEQTHNHHNLIRQKEADDTLYANYHLLLLNLHKLQTVKEATHASFEQANKKESS